MTKQYKIMPFYIMAAADKVLCDGESMTGLGGRVSGADIEVLDTWREMTEEEALALTDDTEATAEDYQAALERLGVEFNEEE